MSSIRTRVEAVLAEHLALVEWVPSEGFEALVDALMEAVTDQGVTIRDLSMTDVRNVLTFSGVATARILNHAEQALGMIHPLHLTVDAGVLKLKVGGYSWSPPIVPDEGVYGG